MHFRSLKGLVSVLILAGTFAPALSQPKGDCATYTSTQKVVDAISDNAMSPSLLDGIDTEAKMQSMLSFVFGEMKKADQGYYTEVYLGTKDADYYRIVNCWGFEGGFDQYCQQAGLKTQYVMYTANQAVFGSKQQYVYAMREGGIMGARLGSVGPSDGSSYSLLDQPWFRQITKSWSSPSYELRDGVQASRYSANILAPEYNTFIASVAAQWTTQETCIKHCEANSFATAWVDTVTSLPATGLTQVGPKELSQSVFKGSNTTNQIFQTLKAMYTVMAAKQNGYATLVEMAYDASGNYLALEDCNTAGKGSIYCCAGNSRYIAYVINSVALSDTDRHIYTFSPQMLAYTDMVQVATDAYAPTSLSWYTSATTAGAWSKLADYTETMKSSDASLMCAIPSAQGQRQALSKKLNINGVEVGVVAAHRFGDEPCYNGCAINSAAYRLVNGLSGTVKDYTTEITTLNDGTNRIQFLARAFLAYDNGNGAGLYMTKKNQNGASEFVAVRNCYSADVDAYCAMADTRLIGMISSVTAFGDNNLRVFPLFDSGDVKTSPSSTGTPEPQQLTGTEASGGFLFSLNETNKTFVYLRPNQTGFGPSIELPGKLGRGRVYQKNVYAFPATDQPVAMIGAIETTAGATCYDTCLINSYAPAAAMDIALNSASIFIDGAKALNAMASTLYQAATSSDTGFLSRVYIAQANGDFHSLVNCQTAENIGNVWCRKAGPDVRFIMYVRMASVTTSRQIFPLYSNGTLAAAIGTEDQPFDASKLPEMSQAVGWGHVSLNADSGSMVQTFVLPVYQVSDGKKIAAIAAERVDREPCFNGCRQNSYALPAAYKLAVKMQQDMGAKYLADPTSHSYQGAGQRILHEMVAIMTDVDYGQNEALMAASADSKFVYEVTNCRAMANFANINCKLAGGTVQFIATILDNFMYVSSGTPGCGDSTCPAQMVAVSLTEAGGVVKVLQNLTFTATEAAVVNTLKEQKYGFNGEDSGVMVAVVENPLKPTFTDPVAYVGATRMGGFEPCYNKCLRNSYAQRAVLAMVANKPDRFLTLQSWMDAKLALNVLLDLFKESDQGHNVMLFFGTEQSDFYSVKNCRSPTALLGDSFCSDAVKRGIKFIFYMRNDKMTLSEAEISFNGLSAPFTEQGRRYVFGMDAKGEFVYMGPADKYDPKQRLWYTQKVGWTPEYQFASGYLGRTFAFPVYDISGTRLVGVVGADRYNVEPCGNACQTNTYAVPAVYSLVANGDLNRFVANSDSEVTVAQAVQQLYNAYEKNDQGNNVNIFFGTNKGDYYSIINCRSIELQRNKYCTNPATTARLLAVVRNEQLFGDKQLRVYQISDTGKLQFSGMRVTKDSIDTLKQEWYVDTVGPVWVLDHSTGLYPRENIFTVPIPKTAANYSSYLAAGTVDSITRGFYESGDTVGVAGAVKSKFEQCSDACQVNSWAVAATHDFLGQDTSSFELASSNATVQEIISGMYDAFKKSDHGHNMQMFYATPGVGKTMNYYKIKNCWLHVTWNDRWCQEANKVNLNSAGTSLVTPWTIAFVENPVVYGDDKTRVWLMDRSKGTLRPWPNQSIANEARAETRTAAFGSMGWFEKKIGWSDLYDLPGSAGVTAQTYSVPASFSSPGVPSSIVAGEKISEEMCFSGLDQDIPSTRVRVKTLDTIQSIAESYDYTWHEMLLLNPTLPNPNDINPNQFVNHAMLYIVAPGDTLFSIAQSYGLSWQQLWEMNPQIPYKARTLEWVEYPSGDPAGFPYYRNLRTKEVKWEKPAEIVEAEKNDLKIFEGQKLAVRPNLRELVCQNQFYGSAKVIRL
jgi:hypothetical protein